MLADLSATPGSLSLSKSNRHAFRSPSPKEPPHRSPRKSPHKSPQKLPHKSLHKSPHKSPRKSPVKGIIVGKAGGSRTHRVPRTFPERVVSYETELIPPHMFPPLKSFAPSSSLLPTSFVLPPPSPRASLPTGPVLPLRREGLPLEEDTLLSPPILEISPPNDNPFDNPVTPPPIRLPFPVAKPFAQRMVHAYSPARPSPLSRILMLADSPATPPKVAPANDSLSPVWASSEDDSQDSLERAVLGVPSRSEPVPPALSLEDMGCDSGTKTPPEKQKNYQPRKGPPARGRVFFPEPNNKKTKTVERSRLSEKENRNSGKQKAFSKPSSGDGNVARKASPVPSNVARVPSKSASKTTKTAPAATKEKPVAKPGAGPRRVPINSADAPPTGKAWKG
jgi:hypothetical protein